MAIDWKSEVGLAVCRERLGQGLSQETLAELCGLSRNYISQIETGVAPLSLSAFIAIAVAMRRMPSELMEVAEEGMDMDYIEQQSVVLT